MLFLLPLASCLHHDEPSDNREELFFAPTTTRKQSKEPSECENATEDRKRERKLVVNNVRNNSFQSSEFSFSNTSLMHSFSDENNREEDQCSSQNKNGLLVPRCFVLRMRRKLGSSVGWRLEP